MPRKKKGGQSPARAPSGVPEGGSRGTSTGYRPSPMANNYTSGTSLSGSAKEDIVRNMKEMFSDLDPEVIYIVLSECDFKVENAMDSLLELSVAAADSGPILAPVSGFERTAAALLSPHHFAEARSETDTANPQLVSSSPTSFLTEDMDLLIDQEVQSLNAQQEVKGGHKSSQFSLTASHSQQLLLDALHLNSKQQCIGSSTEKLQNLQIFGASSPFDQLSTSEDENSQGHEQVVDFKHLTTETPADKNITTTSMNLVASRRPSAFQVYTKQNPLNPLLEGAEVMASSATCPPVATISKSMTSHKKMDSSLLSTWNTEAPVFYPQVQENLGPAFITPVATNWPCEPRSVTSWQRPVSQAPLRPSAAIPRSWALPHPPHPPDSRLRLEGKVLVLLRGAPGSGKSTLAKALLAHNPGGVILSTDDYFKVNKDYHFDPTALGEAHSWNHNRAKIAFERGANPIIIDNTNMQGWEMKPYVVQALKHNYKVLFREPDTWWKNKPRELERRSTHDVPVERIRRMLDGYERFVTVKSIMGSQIPVWKQQVATETRIQPETIVPCPDLVGEPGETDENNKSHSQLISSLPDVSTVHDSSSKSTQNLQENINMDMESLDTELDQPSVNQVFPDCIVESVINEDNCKDEMPVAFSESIRQRVRERPSRRADLDSLEPPVVVTDTNHSEDTDVRQKENTAEEMTKSEEVKMLNFDGDWPTTGLLDQRQLRREKRQHGKDNKAEEAKDNKLGADNESTERKDLSKSDTTELQKLFDLIQTGVASMYTDSSPLSSLSSSSGDELETDVKNDGRFEESQSSQYDNVEQNLKEEKFKGVELPDCISVSKASEMCMVGAPEVVIEPTAGQHEINSNTSTEDNREIQDKEELFCSHVCQSLEFEGFVESESSLGEASGSQERKHRPNRRSGKQCKLAMTFTQNCLESSADSPESSAAATPHTDDPSLDFKPNIDLCTELDTKPDYEAQPSSSTQTESQDYALLWRVNHQNSPDTSVAESSSNITVIYGDPTRFLPEMFCGTTAIQPTNHKEVPYYVVHEKGTQVVEKDLGTTQDQLDHLHILRRHFKLVTLDTLEDLYQKCQQDLEWTTNLLLDSGERFFRDDESEEEEDQSCAHGGDEQVVNLRPCSDMLNVLQFKEQNSAGPDVVVEEMQQSNGAACEPWSSSNTDSCGSIAAPGFTVGASIPQEKNNDDNETLLETEGSVPKSENKVDLSDNTKQKVTLHPEWEGEAWGGSTADAVGIEGLADETQDDISSMVEVHRLLQAELEELDIEEKAQEEEMAKRQNVNEKRKQHIDIKSVELKLPTELALQLTELFGPVGVDPDTCSPEDYVLQMDLNLAKLLHQKWKESVHEKQKQAALSLQLLQESSAHWGNQQLWPVERSNPKRFQMSTDGTPDSRSDAGSRLPFMDHWNVSRPHVSLRNIIKEELVLQENRDKARRSQTVVDKRDGASLLKEEQLFARFPTIDRHFLQDIFRDHNYSLTQTELFLHSLLDEGPVKTVVAPEAPRITPHRAESKDRAKPVESVMPAYQDTEDPEYQDFRAEANLQRRRQLESFAKAAEAYKQGHKEVASFYAQQGHLHGQRMNEANHRAAVQIFERVNLSLLPQNILDLHGLHVDEALEHLNQVLEKKTRECEQGLCRPQLSVITGRGNHSLGGVARIRPAVIDYLTNKHYRFTEPKPGLVLVSLK